MKPKLFQYAACPFCNKVRSILEYKGVDFETIEVHPLNKKEISFSADYRAVPIYIDSEGKQINDSTPIMRRIDEEFPTPKVFKTDSEEAGKDELWLAWSEKLVKGLPTAIYNSISNALSAFDYITKIGKFGWFEKRMIKYTGAFVMMLVSKKIRKREQIDQPEEFVKQMAKEWGDGLGGRPFMGGDKPSASDLSVFGITRPVSDLRAGKLLEDNQEFSAWVKRMQKALATSPVQLTGESPLAQNVSSFDGK